MANGDGWTPRGPEGLEEAPEAGEAVDEWVLLSMHAGVKKVEEYSTRGRGLS